MSEPISLSLGNAKIEICINWYMIDKFNTYMYQGPLDRLDVIESYFVSCFPLQVQDLLNPKQTDLPIREDQLKNIFVTGLSEKVIHNIKEFNDSFGPASRNR